MRPGGAHARFILEHMQTEAVLVEQRAPEFLQFVQVAWGYGELSRRALATGEDPSAFLNVIMAACERTALAS